jgi:hypothetical protein
MDRRRSRRAFSRWIWCLALAVATLAVAATFDGLASGPGRDAPLCVFLTPVPLDPRRPDADRVGALRYRGGLWLRSDDSRFGGLSDLRVSADGRTLRAVSDCGYGLTAALSYDGEGRLHGLDEPRLFDLSGPEGQPLALGERDAESLVVHDGALEVGFEGKARIWAYALDPPFAGPARPVPTPAGLAGCGPNGGIEAMAMIDDSRRLLVCESRRGASQDVPAWIGSGEGWAERAYPLLFRDGWAGEPYRATGAALLPGGDVVLLERRFPPIGSRVVRIAKPDLDAAGPLHPVELATIESPLTDDNFEGIDARRDEAGGTLLYLVSDDNNCAKQPGGSRGTGLQRTLLLMFALEE